MVLSWHSSENLLNASIIFWGLWLVPLAWLVFRCGFLPRTLAVLGKVMGYAFLIPGTVGEMGTALWLLIRGTGKVRA